MALWVLRDTTWRGEIQHGGARSLRKTHTRFFDFHRLFFHLNTSKPTYQSIDPQPEYFHHILEELADLEDYINHHYNRCKMNTDPQTPSNKQKKTTSTDTDDLQTTTEVEVSVLHSINKKLDLLVTLHNEIKELCTSLDFAQSYIEKLEQSNNTLHTSVETLTKNMDLVMKENRKMKETILDIQTRSMRDNLIFSGIPENQPDNPETLIKDFIKTELKLPRDTVTRSPFTVFTILAPATTTHPYWSSSNWNTTNTRNC